MMFWFGGNLTLLGINVMQYNNLLEKQTQEEEQLLLKMKQDKEMEELRLRARKSRINQSEKQWQEDLQILSSLKSIGVSASALAQVESDLEKKRQVKGTIKRQ